LIAWLGILLVATPGSCSSRARVRAGVGVAAQGGLGDAVPAGRDRAGGLAAWRIGFHSRPPRIPVAVRAGSHPAEPLQYVPAVEVLWAAARGAFSVALPAAAVAPRCATLLPGSSRACAGLIAIAVAMLPMSLTSAAGFLAEYVPPS
jgi:hypothetical protein